MNRTNRTGSDHTNRRWLVTFALMAAMAVTALDTTIVSTAMPTVVGELGGVDRYGWVFAAYLLTATTTVPLFSKLSDLRGRKPIFFLGLALFISGSVLCAMAGSMDQLIGARAWQGLGAGAVQPLALTMVGDTFAPEQRAKLQGLFTSVWGLAALIGPAMGAGITMTIGWRWVFVVSLPVSLTAMAIIALVFEDKVVRTRHSIDWRGTVMLTAAVLLVLVAVTEVGARAGWSSLSFILMLSVALAAFLVFLAVERRVAEPVIDLRLLRRPLLAAGLSIQLLSGVLLFGAQTYVPPMVQGVYGGTPLDAGLVVAAMSITWSLSAFLAGPWLLRSGSARPMRAGATSLVIGSVLLLTIADVRFLAAPVVANMFIGAGMGLTSTTLLVVIQSSVATEQRGVATGLLQFSRTLGGALGVGLLGAALVSRGGPASAAALQLGASPATDAVADLAAGLTITYAGLAAVSAVVLVLVFRWLPDVDVHGRATEASHRDR